MMWMDVHFGFRRRLRGLGGTSIALVMLALGIGITASVLSLIRAVVLQPLPFREPEDLVFITSLRNTAGTEETWPVSYPDFLDWKARSHAFTDLSVFTDETPLKLPGPEGPDMVGGELVSASYFRLLGVKPSRGRALLPDEDGKPGANNVVVLGHELWRQRFQGDQAILGKSIDLNETSFTVIGVMPEGFQGISDKAQLWIPISMADLVQSQNKALDSRKFRWLSVIGRLRRGQTIEGARRDLDNAVAHLRREYPDTNNEIGASVEPLALAWFGHLRPVLLLLLAGSIFVLLIAYGNLSNLWLADLTTRQSEIGLRAILGASRSRLIRQLLTETLMLVLVGAVLGLGVAAFSNRAIARSTGIALRSFIHVRIDPYVLGAILGLAALLGLLFGSLSAFVGTGPRSLGSLSGGGGQTATVGRRGRWLQSLLIVYELTLATVLLLGAGLMTEDFLRLSQSDLGFRTDHLLTVRTTTKGQRYADDERMRSVVLQATDRLGALPGVMGVTFVGPAIPTDDWHGFHITLEDREETDPDDLPLILRHHVSPDYFRTLGIPILRGRAFSTGDHKGTLPVVVISDAMARRFWPQGNPLGKRLKLGARDLRESPWLTVVGVAGNVKHEGRGGGARPGPDMYLPILQSIPRNPPVLNFIVRCSVPPSALASAVIREFRRVAPGLPTYDVKTMEERLTKQLSTKKLLTSLMIASALLALLLSMGGIYGMVSCIVNQRLRELGIRLAFGATPTQVTRLLVGQGLRLAVLGIGCGILVTFGLRRLTAGFLYSIGALEPALVVVMAALLTSLVLIACYIPVRRALKAESITAITRGLSSGHH